jgi:hypothetical protein
MQAVSRSDVCLDCFARHLVDDRSDIRFESPRIAHDKLIHGPLQHGDELGRDVLLDVEHAERRAALSRRLKSRRKNIPYRLLWKRG